VALRRILSSGVAWWRARLADH